MERITKRLHEGFKFIKLPIEEIEKNLSSPDIDDSAWESVTVPHDWATGHDFKKEYDITIMEYVMKKRMEKAARLLLNSELSIREVAEECGFCDNEYFSRCFKNYHGTSPVSWRKQLREKEDEQ